MDIGKYKYYFRKPKSEIVKDVFSSLVLGGAMIIAANSPYFWKNIVSAHKKWHRYSKKKITDTFYSLKKQGFIAIAEKNHQIYISLTEKGRYKAGIFQINTLKISKPKRWDGKWRLLIFDVAHKRRIYREALRGKLKELGFCLLQKSVWIHSFDCSAEVALLKDFFGFSEQEIRLIVADNIGDDDKYRKIFHLL